MHNKGKNNRYYQFFVYGPQYTKMCIFGYSGGPGWPINNRIGPILLKGLRLVMWSLLHDTDQLREMLSTDQSLRDRRSRGLWSVLSISRG